MEKILKELSAIIASLNMPPNKLYSIGFMKDVITLQGNYDSGIVAFLIANGAKFEINDSGHAITETDVELQIPEDSYKVKVRIVLT